MLAALNITWVPSGTPAMYLGAFGDSHPLSSAATDWVSQTYFTCILLCTYMPRIVYLHSPVQVGVTLVLPKDGLTTQWVASAKECRNALASIHLQARDSHLIS